MEIEVLIKETYIAALLQSLLSRSEKMMGEIREDDRANSRGEEAVLERACQEIDHECRESHGWRYSKALTMS